MTSPFLFLTECAAHARVPVSTVRHWIAAGRLASIRPGRRRMVRRDDFEAFLLGAETQRKERASAPSLGAGSCEAAAISTSFVR
jgi:excisionase family DNA binding protein